MSRTIKMPYTGSKRFDSSCRAHGRCPYCRGNRTFKSSAKGNVPLPILLLLIEWAEDFYAEAD